jgi:hypothetical protein
MVLGLSQAATLQHCGRSRNQTAAVPQIEKGSCLRGNIKSDCMSLPWQDLFEVTEEFTMAEINKLSVGKVLDKLRSNDEQKKTKDMQREEQLKAMNEELQRLRTPGQRDGG